MTDSGRRTGAAIAWGVYGSIAAGVMGILGMILFFVAQPVAAAVCILAAAVAFGLLANAVLRQ